MAGALLLGPSCNEAEAAAHPSAIVGSVFDDGTEVSFLEGSSLNDGDTLIEWAPDEVQAVANGYVVDITFPAGTTFTVRVQARSKNSSGRGVA